MPGPSVFPSGEPGVSGDFWGSQEGCQLKLMSIELMLPSNHFILCYSLLLPPSIFPSIRIFSSELALHSRWPKYWIRSPAEGEGQEGFPLPPEKARWDSPPVNSQG